MTEITKGTLVHFRSQTRAVHQLKVIDQNKEITIPNDYLTRNNFSEAQNTNQNTY